MQLAAGTPIGLAAPLETRGAYSLGLPSSRGRVAGVRRRRDTAARVAGGEQGLSPGLIHMTAGGAAPQGSAAGCARAAAGAATAGAAARFLCAGLAPAPSLAARVTAGAGPWRRLLAASAASHSLCKHPLPHPLRSCVMCVVCVACGGSSRRAREPGSRQRTPTPSLTRRFTLSLPLPVPSCGVGCQEGIDLPQRAVLQLVGPPCYSCNRRRRRGGGKVSLGTAFWQKQALAQHSGSAALPLHAQSLGRARQSLQPHLGSRGCHSSSALSCWLLLRAHLAPGVCLKHTSGKPADAVASRRPLLSRRRSWTLPLTTAASSCR